MRELQRETLILRRYQILKVRRNRSGLKLTDGNLKAIAERYVLSSFEIKNHGKASKVREG